MKRKILALSIVLTMAASVLSPVAMAQTVSDSLPTTAAASTNTAERINAGGIALDEATFPDANFRAVVAQYDADKSGSLSQAELDAVKEMDASGKNIASLEGIQYFTALEKLNVLKNQLTELNVSANTALTSLEAGENQLTALDVSANTKLTYLGVMTNQLKALDVSKNTALTYLEVSGNQFLTSLDLSANTALETLNVMGDLSLYSLDLSANTALKSLNASFTSLAGLKLGSDIPAEDFELADPSEVYLTAQSGASVDLKTYIPFFDASNVSDVVGGKIDANGILTDWSPNFAVSYTYDAGFGKKLNVVLTVRDEVSTGEIAIDEILFPDVNFRAVVAQYDTDKSGSLSQAERDAVKEMDASGKNIASLEGIQYFTALEKLNVLKNQLTTLDVSKNTALVELEAGENQLTALDVSANTKLTYLGVMTNQLKALDVSKNTALTYLEVSGNQFLTSLDLSANTALETLNVMGDLSLYSLDLSANTALKSLNASFTSLAGLKLGSDIPAEDFEIADPSEVYLTAQSGASVDLKTYIPFFDARKVSDVVGGKIDANGILTDWKADFGVTYTYDAGFGKKLNVVLTVREEVPAGEIPLDETIFPDVHFLAAVYQYDTDYNDRLSQAELDAVTRIVIVGDRLTSLKGIEYFTSLERLNVSGHQLKELDISKNTALKEIYVSNNKLTSLDLSANKALEVLAVDGNQLTGLDLSKNTALTSLYANENQLTSLNVTGCTQLKRLEASENQLTSLDVSANKQLQLLELIGNQLTELNLSQNTALDHLDVSGNKLKTLDVTKNTALKRLSVLNNQLTALDVSKNTALTDLEAGSNQLTTLDVSANTALTYLGVMTNQLKALDVSKNTALTYLEVSGNPALTSLDLSANKALTSLGALGTPLTALKLGSEPTDYFAVDELVKVSATAAAGTGVNLKAYAPFFDASKVSNVKGGSIDANGVLTGWTSGTPVTYTYNAGFNKALNVALTVTASGDNTTTPPTGGNGSGTQPTTPTPGASAIAQTGDHSAVGVWGSMMALCGAAAAGLMMIRKKDRK